MAMPPRPLTLRCAATLVALLLLTAPASGQRVRQITEFKVTHLGTYDYATDDAGGVVFFVASIDPLGSNPGYLMQVFKKSLPGGLPVQVTTLEADAFNVSVSDDGSAILFGSGADPLGANADGSPELFLADADGGSMVQLTDHPAVVGVYEAVLSGDGGTALFVSDGDLAGQNPALVPQLFAVGTDGTNLRQLTSASASGACGDLAISDDGQRIIFVDDRDLTGANGDGSPELFAVAGDGTGLTQVTGNTYVDAAALAGGGSRIVYVRDYALYYVDWGSSPQTMLADNVRWTSVTDAGDEVYYSTFSSLADIYSIAIDGGSAAAGASSDDTRKPPDPPVPVPVWVSPDNATRPLVSGAGTRLLFMLKGETAPFLANPDGLELLATDGAGLTPEQVVEASENGRVWSFEMTADGSRIVFPWGEGVYWDSLDLFLAETESGNVTPVTDRAASVNPVISDDGNSIVFFSAEYLIPEECDMGGIYRVNADGSALTQLAPDPVTCDSIANPAGNFPGISNDGSTVVYQDYGSAELYGVSATGGPNWAVTADLDSLHKTPRIDGTGTWVTYMSGSDVTGMNPDGRWEIFQVRMDGSGLKQITVDPDYTSMRPDISASGERIVYYSYADPLGTNPEHNAEIFLYDTGTTATEQLTVTAGGNNLYPRISPNGAFVAFYSTSPWVSSTAMAELYRLELATGEVQLVSAGMAWMDENIRHNLTLDVDDAGNVAFCGNGDLVGHNADLNVELWLAEFEVEPSFDFGAGDPTLLQWDPAPWALGYDVIRGDLASLAAGVGDTVDLGEVVCLENDSPDAMAFADDVAELAPGQGFFYLYRGDPGDLVGPGSWGQGSNGAERVPADGSCPSTP